MALAGSCGSWRGGGAAPHGAFRSRHQTKFHTSQIEFVGCYCYSCVHQGTTVASKTIQSQMEITQFDASECRETAVVYISVEFVFEQSAQVLFPIPHK